MGKENGSLYNITAVEIHMHGDHAYMGESDGTAYITPYILRWKIEEKNIGCVVLLGCNVGNIDYSASNIAANFARKINGGKVIASDGTVNWSFRDWGFLQIHYTSEYDKYFVFDAMDKTRDNEGWLVYQYVDKKIIVSEGQGKDFTLDELYSLAD